VDAPVKLYHPTDGELPYVNIGRYLRRIGVPVPRVVGADEAGGLVLLEDLGASLLSDVVTRRPEAARTLYRKAVEILVSLQAGGRSEPDPGCFAFQMEFGYPIVRWELAHFLEFGVEARFGALPAAVRTEMELALDALARLIDGIERVLIHRDYHARNLIVSGADEIGVVDFQDALLGPETYDIASLLFDAYTELDGALREELVRYYLDLRGTKGLEPREFDEFFEQVKLTALQRYLKIVGRFVFLAERRGKRGFLSYVPLVSKNAASLLDELPLMAKLGSLVRPYLAGGAI